MDVDSITRVSILLALSILSLSFLSGAQAAFTGLSKARLKSLAAKGGKRAAIALSVAENHDRLFSSLLIGKNAVKIFSSVLAAAVSFRLFGGIGLVVCAVVMTGVAVLFGEVTLGSLADNSAEKFILFASPFLRAVIFILTPFHLLLALWNKLLTTVFSIGGNAVITEEELITIVEEAQIEGGLDEHEGELIRSAIEFNDLEVRSILTPRVDITAVEDDSSVEDIAEVFRTHGFSRIPVYRDTIDNIIGIIHEKDFNRLIYEGGTDLFSVLHDAVFITESMNISKLLRLFQEAKVHMAIVVDEFGGTAGIITLEDVLEGLVGEIWDEHDEVINDITEIAGNTYLVTCSAPFSILTEKFGVADEEDFSTVGVWVLDRVAKMPEVGDRFNEGALDVEITKTDGRRAVEIKITIGAGDQTHLAGKEKPEGKRVTGTQKTPGDKGTPEGK